LHNACQFKANALLVKLLLEHGADVNKANVGGVTPLHIATYHNALPTVIELLLEDGANPNARDVNCGTPLHDASYQGSSVELVKLLLEFGADASIKAGSPPVTALQVATTLNHKHLIPILTNPPPPTRMKIRHKQIASLDACAFCSKPSTSHFRLSKCKGCYSVAYCDAKCAKADWGNHKQHCKPIVSTSSDGGADTKPQQISTSTTQQSSSNGR
jgi:hypothetical protein